MKIKVMCTYCGRIASVDKTIADKLNETTAFCCGKCAKGCANLGRGEPVIPEQGGSKPRLEGIIGQIWVGNRLCH